MRHDREMGCGCGYLGVKWDTDGESEWTASEHGTSAEDGRYDRTTENRWSDEDMREQSIVRAGIRYARSIHSPSLTATGLSSKKICKKREKQGRRSAGRERE